jgi:DNA-binding PadR family transcriptional regulator
MHDEEEWPHRGGRRGWHGERGERGERGGPWGPPRARLRSSPVPRHELQALAKHFWGDEPRRARVKRGDVRAAALALLAEEPRNGYQIIQEIAVRSGGAWQPSPGSVYPALQQLEDEGLIRAVDSDGSRRAFTLTDEGHSYVETHADEVAAPWEVVAGRERSSIREMRELIGQLAMAAMQVTQAGSEAQVTEAQRILGNTRRALYRILAAEDDDQESPRDEGGRDDSPADEGGTGREDRD